MSELRYSGLNMEIFTNFLFFEIIYMSESRYSGLKD
jgi:hypothetical protein